MSKALLMRSRPLIVLLCLIALSISQSAEAAHPSQSSPYRIQLRSRQFVPSPGVEPAARNRLSSEAGVQHVIVQLNAIPSAEVQQAIAAKGIRLLNYLPDRAWFATVGPSAVAQVSAAGEVRWLGDIQVADKLPERLLRGQPLVHALKDGVLSLRLYYFDDVSESATIAAVTRHSGVIEQRSALLHALSLRLPINQLTALAAEDVVRWLEEAPPPPTPLIDSIRSRMRVNEVQAAPYNLTGSGVVIGLWDCSPVWPHVDFAGRLTNVGGQIEDCAPASQHSTHVAGIMAGSGANSQVIPGSVPFQWKGVAPGAQLVSYDYYNSISEVQSALSAYNIDLSQNSWAILPTGEPCDSIYGNYNYLAPEYDQIVTGVYGKRLSVAFAAGNQQNSIISPSCTYYHTVTPPGTAKNVLTVGATNSLDESMTDFSSWGPTDDGRIKPDVVAPGYRSDYPGVVGCSTSFVTGIVSTCPNNTYGMLKGTSMATPAVSGVLALMLQQYRITTGQPLTNPLPSTLKALAIHGAVDLGNAGPDFQFGWGRVDAKDSVDLTRKSKSRESSLSNEQVVTYTANVFSCDTTLKATLAWDDPAAAQNAIPALVNDLDLSLVSPNNTTYYPWVLSPGIPSNPATRGVDITNNVEQVLVSAPMAGAWTIRVRGNSVPQAPQRFSLVSAALNTPMLNAATPTIVQPGAQVVLRGSQFDAGCSPGNISVSFGGNVSATVTPANYTFDTITVTVPLNAQTGDVSVTTVAGTSNPIFLAVVRPSIYLPLTLKNFPPPFSWIDASDGTRIVNGDDVTQTISIPFPFAFFGSTYASVTVSSNGFITFDPNSDSHNSNTCIPNSASPNNAIYAFWTDLDASAAAGGAVWAKTVGNSLVIEWQNVPRWSTQELETFEIILSADSSIIIQYLSLQNTLNAVVGIENATGTAALQNYCNGLGLTPYNSQLVYYLQP